MRFKLKKKLKDKTEVTALNIEFFRSCCFAFGMEVSHQKGRDRTQFAGVAHGKSELLISCWFGGLI